MSAEFSTIFGLSLSEMVEIINVMSMTGHIIIAIAVFFTNDYQLRRKIKVDSARLILEFSKP